MIKKLFNNIKMKVFESLLGKVIDRFKARNPKTFAYVVLALVTIHSFAMAATATSLGMLENYPELVESLPSWIGDIPTQVSGFLYLLSGALLTLTGSSTPTGYGVAQLVYIQKQHIYENVTYLPDRHYYVKNRVAEYLISAGYARAVIPEKEAHSS